MGNFSIFLLALAAAVSAFTPHSNPAESHDPESEKLSQQILKDFEGFTEKPYWDVNALRAGYGSDTVTLDDGTVLPVDASTVVDEQLAQNDLERRVKEFQDVIRSQTDSFDKLPSEVKAALTSVAYNYGSLPQNVVSAVEGGDIEAIASSVESLKTHDNGINASRREKEANLIRKGLLSP